MSVSRRHTQLIYGQNCLYLRSVQLCSWRKINERKERERKRMKRVREMEIVTVTEYTLWWQSVGRCSPVPVDYFTSFTCYLFVWLSLLRQLQSVGSLVIISIMKRYGEIGVNDRFVTFNSVSFSLSFSLSLSLYLSGPPISLFIHYNFFRDRLSNSCFIADKNVRLAYVKCVSRWILSST